MRGLAAWASGRGPSGPLGWHKMEIPGTPPPFPGISSGRRRSAPKPKEADFRRPAGWRSPRASCRQPPFLPVEMAAPGAGGGVAEDFTAGTLPPRTARPRLHRPARDGPAAFPGGPRWAQSSQHHLVVPRAKDTKRLQCRTAGGWSAPSGAGGLPRGAARGAARRVRAAPAPPPAGVGPRPTAGQSPCWMGRLPPGPGPVDRPRAGGGARGPAMPGSPAARGSGAPPARRRRRPPARGPGRPPG